jgi:hypothetical protein
MRGDWYSLSIFSAESFDVRPPARKEIEMNLKKAYGRLVRHDLLGCSFWGLMRKPKQSSG